MSESTRDHKSGFPSTSEKDPRRSNSGIPGAVALPGKPGGRRWLARPDSIEIAQIMANNLDSIESLPEYAVIKKEQVRSVFRVRPEPGGRELVVKHYHARPRDLVKHLIIPNKAVSEWRAWWRLSNAGIRVPEFLAMGEKRRGPFYEDACLVMEAIPGCMTAYQYISPIFDTCCTDPQKRRDALARIAELCASMHEHGIFHCDFHAGNLLVTKDARGEAQLHVIDLHRVKFPKPLRTKHRVLTIANIVRNLNLYWRVDREEVREMCMHYASVAGLDEDLTNRMWPWVIRYALRRERNRVKKRTLRSLKNTSDLAVEKTNGYKLHRAKEITADQVIATLDEHRRHTQADDAEVVHRSRVGTLTRTSSGLCVKEWFGRGTADALRSRFSASKAKMAWMASHGLVLRQVNTPKPLAMVEEKGVRGSCYLITRYEPDARPLHLALADLIAAPDSVPEEEALGRAVAEQVGGLHAVGIYHGDLSAKNFLVERSARGWKVSIVDLDNVGRWRKLTRRRRLKSLAQLNDLPEGVSSRARLAFVKKYNSYNPNAIDRRAMKEISRFTGARAAKRNSKQSK